MQKDYIDDIYSTDSQLNNACDEFQNDTVVSYNDSDDSLIDDIDFKIDIKCNKNFTDFSEKIEKDDANLNIDDIGTSAINRVDFDSIKMYLDDISNFKLLTPEEECQYNAIIKQGKIASIRLKAFNNNKLDLSFDEVAKLNEQIEKGFEYRDYMFESNTRLVVSIAKKFMGKGIEFNDIIQHGNEGLLKAIDKYDANKGFRFSTYATWWIVQTIQRGIANDGRTIRLPVHNLEKINRYHMIEFALENKLGRAPSVEEVAKEIGISVKEYAKYVNQARAISSLDAAIDEDEETFGIDMAEDKEGLTTAEYSYEKKKLEDIYNAIIKLPDDEKDVMLWRYGYIDGDGHTLDYVGKKIGLTRERIRQKEASAIVKLRRALPQYMHENSCHSKRK